MDQESDQINDTTKIPIRRRYEVAFSSEEEYEEDGEQIVPETTPTVKDPDEVEDLDRETEEGDKVQNRFSCQVPSCVMTFATEGEYQSHYNARHMHSCSICKRHLPSSHILELHVLELHDTWFSLMAEKKPMYQCFLETCPEKFQTTDIRKEHCIGEHKFSQKFHYWDCNPPRSQSRKVNSKKVPDKRTTKPGSSAPKNKDSSMEEANNNSGDLCMELDMTSSVTVPGSKSKGNASKSDTKPPRSMPKHVAFGRAPHRAFQNAYTVAIDPAKDNKKRAGNGEDNTVIDMKDVEDALVTSSEFDISAAK